MNVAVVTGGNKGIGLGISKELLKNNFKVIVGGRSTYEDKESFSKIDFIKADLENFEGHEKLAKTAVEKYGKLDLYVNNVGISEWKPIKDVDEYFLNKLIKTNIHSAFWGCKAAEKFLCKKTGLPHLLSIKEEKYLSKNIITKYANQLIKKGVFNDEILH